MATNYKFLLVDLPPEKKKTFNSFRDRLKCKSVATLWCVSGKLWWIFGSWGDYTCQGGNQVVSKHFWKTCTLASKDRIRIGGLGFQSSIVTNLPSMVKHWLIYSHHSRFWPLLHGCSGITFLQCFNMRYEEPYYNPDKLPVKIKIPVSPRFRPDVAYLPVSIFGTWQQTRLTQDPSHPRISGLIQVCCLPCIEFIKGGTSELMSTCLSFWSTRSTVCDNNHHIWIHDNTCGM